MDMHVAIRHAYILTQKTISEKVLVLGACVRSHVWVVLHSVWNAGVIHVITNLGCKFKRVYSDKELLGSMKVLAMIADQLDFGDTICGAVLTIRFGEDILSVWNRNATHIQAVMACRDSIKRHFHLPVGYMLYI